jgi:hypothetical protein
MIQGTWNLIAGKTYDRRRYMSSSLNVVFDVDDSSPFDTVLLSVQYQRGIGDQARIGH